MPGATSRRTTPRATSLRSTPRVASRRAGSSCRRLRGEKGGEVDGMPLQLLEEDEQAMIGDPLRVEDAIEVIAFVLDDPRVEALDLALDDFAVEPRAAIADPQVSRYDAAQPGDRQAALPSERPLAPERFDHRVDQHR